MGITPGPWRLGKTDTNGWRHVSAVAPVCAVHDPLTVKGRRDANAALIAAAPEIAAALVAIVDAFREPHYGDREQQADSVFMAIEQTGAFALVEKLKGILR